MKQTEQCFLSTSTGHHTELDCITVMCLGFYYDADKGNTTTKPKLIRARGWEKGKWRWRLQGALPQVVGGGMAPSHETHFLSYNARLNRISNQTEDKVTALMSASFIRNHFVCVSLKWPCLLLNVTETHLHTRYYRLLKSQLRWEDLQFKPFAQRYFSIFINYPFYY